MRGSIRWLVAPAALALVLAFCSAQPAEAHRWAYRYGAHAPCHYSYRAYPYGAYYALPRVSVYRAPLVVPSSARYYRPYGVHHAPRPVARYHVW